jgi:hypothetical protein
MTIFHLGFIHCLNTNRILEITTGSAGTLAKLSYLDQLARSGRMTMYNGKTWPFSFNGRHCDAALNLRAARSTEARAAQESFWE